MYGLPENFDCSFFDGRKVEMICITANQIYLHFDQELTLTIEGRYSIQTSNLAISKSIQVPEIDLALFGTIEQPVLRSAAEPSGTLTLVFQSGYTVKCYDDTELYEAYRIQNGSSTIVV
jgi:hypothetical protein